MATKKLFFGVLISISSLPLFSQKVVKVRGQQSKEILYSFKEGEFLATGESKLYLKSIAMNVEFIISNQNQSTNTLYKNKLKIASFPIWYYRFTDFDYWYEYPDTKNSSLRTIKFANGESFGPFQELYPYTDSKSNKCVLYSYSKNGKRHLTIPAQKKTIGPCDKIEVKSASIERIVFTYYKENKWYIFMNGKDYGPYAAIQTSYDYQGKDPVHFMFKKADDSKWKVFYQNELPYEFTSCPSLMFMENGKIIISGSMSDGYFHILDGKKYAEKPGETKVFFDTKGDNQLVAKYEGGSNQNPTLYAKDVKIGNYEHINLYNGSSVKSSFVTALFRAEVTESGSSYYGFNGQMVKLFDLKKGESCEVKFIGNDCYYLNTTDSILYKNNVEIHRQVRSIYIEGNELVIYKINKGYDEFYNLNKKLSVGELQKMGYNSMWYNMKENEFSFSKKDGKDFISAKNTSLLFPIYSRYNDFAFSTDKKHVLEAANRRMEIYLDGKYLSPGFSISYNPETNCFYWISVDKKHLYLHSYHLN